MATTTMSKKHGARKPQQATNGKGRDPLLLANGQTRASDDAMRGALLIFGIDAPKNATSFDLVELVRGRLAVDLAALPDTEVLVCDECGERSTDATEFCPLCGHAEGDDAKAIVADVVETTAEDKLAVLKTRYDENVVTIDRLKNDFKMHGFDLGLALRENHEQELWKAGGFKSFSDFLASKVSGIGPSHAYKLMDVSKKFDRPTFEKIGSSKLAIVSQIEDPGARDEALAAAKAGAGKRSLNRAKNAANGKAPPAKEREHVSAAVERMAAPAKQSANQITLLAKVGSRAELHQWRSATSHRQLKVHAPDAYVEVPISEGVVLHIALKQDREGASVGVTTRFVRSEQ